MEQVVSHGTEGRRGDPTKEIAGSDNVYEYIVFRGGDVKDLRIEETAVKPKPQQQVPDDPAILGVRINISVRLGRVMSEHKPVSHTRPNALHHQSF